MILNNVGDQLYTLRRLKRMSQETLAATSGVSRSYIFLIESGTAAFENISIGVLKKLFAALGKDITIHAEDTQAPLPDKDESPNKEICQTPDVPGGVQADP
jgi:transcriptional regulator with XRE-family HTH domain